MVLADHAGLAISARTLELAASGATVVALASLPAVALLGGRSLLVVVPTVLVAALCRLGPHLVRQPLEARARSRRDKALPATLESLAGELRSGASLRTAIATVAARTPGRLGVELARVRDSLGAGAGVGDAVRDWRDGSDSSEVTIAATAMVLAATSGGPAARSIDAVAASLRERAQVRAEARALATQARASAAVLGLAPAGFALVVAAVDPRAAAFLVRPGLGLACAVVGLALLGTGLWWMHRIVRDVG